MDIASLKRDADKVKATLKEVGDTVVTTKGCKICIPTRFRDRNLASVGATNSSVGIFAIVVDDKYYAISLTPARINFDPTSINMIKIDGDDYIEFYFEPGSVVISDVELVKDDTLPYYIYNELIAGARIPWYVNYLDMAGLFDEASFHAGFKVGASPAVIGMIISVIARNHKDRTQHYRHALKTFNDIKNNPPDWVKFNNVTYTATNTTARLVGSYFVPAIEAALMNPSTSREELEDLLLT